MDEITDINYWDCECEKDYIHPKREYLCRKCNARQEDQPDSLKAEVEKFIHVEYHSEARGSSFYRDCKVCGLKLAPQMLTANFERINGGEWVIVSWECLHHGAKNELPKM